MPARIALTLLAIWLLSGGSAAGQDAGVQGRRYSVKASDVIVPPGVEVGRYRRIIQPFGGWTLICDENLAAMQKVCNVSQTIVNSEQKMVFSWSLAATETGQPMMILRTTPDLAGDRVTIGFADTQEALPVTMEGCDETVCVGLAPVAPVLRRHIVAGASAEVRFGTRNGAVVLIEAPLAGLASALEAID